MILDNPIPLAHRNSPVAQSGPLTVHCLKPSQNPKIAVEGGMSPKKPAEAAGQ